MRRIASVLAGLAVVAAVASPLLHPDRDSFPLSPYPMFSHPIDAVIDFDTVRAVGVEGERMLLNPRLIAATDEVIVASGTVGRAVAAGDSDRLCREVAARLAGTEMAAERVEVLTERYDAVAYFDGRRRAERVTVHDTCPVPG